MVRIVKNEQYFQRQAKELYIPYLVKITDTLTLPIFISIHHTSSFKGLL